MDAQLDTKPQTLAAAEAAPLGLIDTHAHIHFKQFAGEVAAVLHRANEAGVSRVITVGIDTADSKRATELAATYENVFATVGIHPHEAAEAEQAGGYLRELTQRRKVVAIGECGLDLYRSTTSIEVQKAALKMQIELAIEFDLPLVFHVRDAFDPFFEVLSAYEGVRGVVHSFTAGPAELERVLNAGLFIALNGIATFAKSEGLAEVVREVPVDRLLVETDCPFLSPAPHRGKQNEPARVVDIVSFIAEARSASIEDLGAQTTRNADSLFKLR